MMIDLNIKLKKPVKRTGFSNFHCEFLSILNDF